jgi:hypothetical protein
MDVRMRDFVCGVSSVVEVDIHQRVECNIHLY